MLSQKVEHCPPQIRYFSQMFYKTVVPNDLGPYPPRVMKSLPKMLVHN